MKEKVAVFLAALVLGAAALAFALQITVAPGYVDFIVGTVAWRAESKLQDLLAVPALVSAFALGYWFFGRQMDHWRLRNQGTGADELATQLIGWSLPALAAMAGLLIGPAIDVKLIGLSAGAVVFLGLGSLVALGSETSGISMRGLGLALFAALLIGLVPLEVTLIAGRISPAPQGAGVIDACLRAFMVLSAIGAVMALGLARYFPSALARALAPALLLGQCGLAAFFLTFIPARLSPPTGGLTAYATTGKLPAIILGLVALSVLDLGRRFRRYLRAPDGPVMALLSPISIAALVLAIKTGTTIPPTLSSDDYHFGEALLGWWSYLKGAIPYRDYAPAHGIIDDDLPGLVSRVFYDATAASVPEASRLSTCLLGLVAFGCIYGFSGSLTLASLTILFTGGRLAWLFFVPFLCLWLLGPLRANRPWWLAVFVATAPVVILGAPNQGFLLVVAFGIIAADHAWRMWGEPWKSWRPVAISLAIVLLPSIVTPVGKMLLGAVQHLLDNGPINQIAYGVPWSASWNLNLRSGFRFGVVFEIVRLSWTVAPLICLWMIRKSLGDRSTRAVKVLPPIVMLVFILLVMPYAMGRIDPGNVSRTGLAAILGCAIVVPLGAWRDVATASRTWLLLLVALVGGALNYTELSLGSFFSVAVATIPTGVLKNGRDIGLVNLGIASVSDESWDRLSRLKSLLDRSLAPGETYLDLSSRTAHYFYMDRRPPVPVPSVYNMVAPAQQQRAIDLLAKNLPRLALLEARNMLHDGGTLPLRAPLLYRFVFDNYTPRFENGFIVGYRKQDVGPPDEAALQLFARAYGTADLGKIPVAWGKSSGSLADKMVLARKLDARPPVAHDLQNAVGAFRVTGKAPSLMFDTSDLGLTGHNSGLLRLTFACATAARATKASSETRLQIFWWGDQQPGPSEGSSLKLTAEDGVLIVPLDAAPLWPMLKTLRGVRIDISDATVCEAITVHDVALYQRTAFAAMAQ